MSVKETIMLYETDLKATLGALGTHGKTAREAAEALRVSKPTAYARLRCLAGEGRVTTTIERRSAHGPLSVVYRKA